MIGLFDIVIYLLHVKSALIIDYAIVKIGQKKKGTNWLPFLKICLKIYFTASTIALKASGLFIAKSANTLRFKPISF